MRHCPICGGTRLEEEDQDGFARCLNRECGEVVFPERDGDEPELTLAEWRETQDLLQGTLETC